MSSSTSVADGPSLSVLVAPSILSSDLSTLLAETRRIVEGGADWIHLDIMDGHFVPNLTIGAPVIRSLRQHLAKGTVYFDCHLMVANPSQWISDFAAAGADQVTFHIESVGSDKQKAIRLATEITAAGMAAGLAVKPVTDLDGAVAGCLDSGLINTLLIMTVEPGFGGQQFIVDMLPKIKAARSRYPHLNIQVDGGINERFAELAGKNGANVFVAGSSIFKRPETETASIIESIRKAGSLFGSH